MAEKPRGVAHCMVESTTSYTVIVDLNIILNATNGHRLDLYACSSNICKANFVYLREIKQFCSFISTSLFMNFILAKIYELYFAKMAAEYNNIQSTKYTKSTSYTHTKYLSLYLFSVLYTLVYRL